MKSKIWKGIGIKIEKDKELAKCYNRLTEKMLYNIFIYERKYLCCGFFRFELQLTTTGKHISRQEFEKELIKYLPKGREVNSNV